jgi:hypothetical protein
MGIAMIKDHSAEQRVERHRSLAEGATDAQLDLTIA